MRSAPAAIVVRTAGGLAFGAFVAALGGLLGIFGAIVEEFRSGGGILLIVAGAPVIEEALKPVGVYLLLARWPRRCTGACTRRRWPLSRA